MSLQIRHGEGRPSPKPKIYIATPAYDGKVYVDYCTSLIAMLQVMDRAGIAYELGIENGDCYVAKARNKLARKFLETDCTHLLFIDADVGFNVDNIPNILVQNYDICVGAYPMKNKDKIFPIRLMADDSGLIFDGDYQRCEMAATGFMVITRQVLEDIREAHSYIEYKTDDGTPEWNFFHCGIINNQWWGEDFDFCRKAVKQGFQIWCYTDVVFRHWGLAHWEARCKDRLNERS